MGDISADSLEDINVMEMTGHSGNSGKVEAVDSKNMEASSTNNSERNDNVADSGETAHRNQSCENKTTTSFVNPGVIKHHQNVAADLMKDDSREDSDMIDMPCHSVNFDEGEAIGCKNKEASAADNGEGNDNVADTGDTAHKNKSCKNKMTTSFVNSGLMRHQNVAAGFMKDDSREDSDMIDMPCHSGNLDEGEAIDSKNKEASATDNGEGNDNVTDTGETAHRNQSSENKPVTFYVNPGLMSYQLLLADRYIEGDQLEDGSIMGMPCYSGNSSNCDPLRRRNTKASATDNGEGNDNVATQSSGGNKSLVETGESAHRNEGGEERQIRVSLPAVDHSIKDINEGASCSGVSTSPKTEKEFSRSPNEEDSIPSAMEFQMTRCGLDLRTTKRLRVKKVEAVGFKCKIRRSKAMMTIRRLHSDRLMQSMDKMRKENFLCDVELEADGGNIFRAHRSVLAASSSYFRAMFSSGLIEGKESRVKMVHISPRIMTVILDFLYTGDLQIGLEEVQDLLVVADMLQLEDVMDGCSQLLKDEIDSTNALGLYRFAEAHNCAAITKAAETYVKQNFVDVAKGEEFLSLPLPVLGHFLSSEELVVDSEMQVFEAAVRWLFHDPPQRRHSVLDVLSHVRLGLLHPGLMSMRASITIPKKDPPLGVALASIRMEIEERVTGERRARFEEDKPRQGAKKHIVVLGGCRREPVAVPRQSRSTYITYQNQPGEVLCAAVEVYDVFHKEWLWKGDSNFSGVNGHGPPPLLNPRILPGVSTIGGIIYVVGGELESQILANVEALDARACILGREYKNVKNEPEAKPKEPEERGTRDSPDESRMSDEDDDDEEEEEEEDEEEEECVAKVGERDEEESDDDERRALEEERRKNDEEIRAGRKRKRNPNPVRWVRVNSMIKPRCEFGLCACDGRLYAFGGWVGSDVDSSIESYDPFLDEWRLEGHLPKSCSGLGVTSHEGLIYIAGGCTHNRRHLTQLLCMKPPRSYDANPSQKSTWCSEYVRLPSMSTPRSQMGICVMHDSIYVVGGMNESTDALKTVERYSLTQNQWYDVSPMREPRSTPSVVAVDGCLYVIGGNNSQQWYHYQTPVSLRTMEKYDPVTNMWFPMPPLPHARGEAAAVVI